MPQIQFDFRGWDFPVATQRQVPAVQTFTVRCSSQGLLTCPSSCNDWRRGAVSPGSFGAPLLLCSGGGTVAGRGRQAVCPLSAGVLELITQVMSSCKLVSVTPLHCTRDVDIHTHKALTETTTTQQQHNNNTQQHTHTHTTTIIQSGEAPSCQARSLHPTLGS